MLASRLLDRQRQERQSKEAAHRKSLIGSGDRSERIRTYNFPQGRVTDHRINLTLYKIDSIMDGELDEVVTALAQEFQAEQLAALSGEAGVSAKGRPEREQAPARQRGRGQCARRGGGPPSANEARRASAEGGPMRAKGRCVAERDNAPAPIGSRCGIVLPVRRRARRFDDVWRLDSDLRVMKYITRQARHARRDARDDRSRHALLRPLSRPRCLVHGAPR